MHQYSSIRLRSAPSLIPLWEGCSPTDSNEKLFRKNRCPLRSLNRVDMASITLSRAGFSEDIGRLKREFTMDISRTSSESFSCTEPSSPECPIPPFLSTTTRKTKSFNILDEEEDYGWFTADLFETENEEINMATVQKRHRESLKHCNISNPNLNTVIEFRAHNPGFIISTKCFGNQCFAWGIGGFRIVKNRSRYAEYQVIVSYGNHTWISWIRSSIFSRFAKIAQARKWRGSIAAWNRVLAEQRLLRCLEVDYLLKKCRCLEIFLRSALFEAKDTQVLLDFAKDSTLDSQHS